MANILLSYAHAFIATPQNLIFTPHHAYPSKNACMPLIIRIQYTSSDFSSQENNTAAQTNNQGENKKATQEEPLHPKKVQSSHFIYRTPSKHLRKDETPEECTICTGMLFDFAYLTASWRAAWETLPVNKISILASPSWLLILRSFPVKTFKLTPISLAVVMYSFLSLSIPPTSTAHIPTLLSDCKVTMPLI